VFLQNTSTAQVDVLQQHTSTAQVDVLLKHVSSFQVAVLMMLVDTEFVHKAASPFCTVFEFASLVSACSVLFLEPDSGLQFFEVGTTVLFCVCVCGCFLFR